MRNKGKFSPKKVHNSSQLRSPGGEGLQEALQGQGQRGFLRKEPGEAPGQQTQHSLLLAAD